MKTCTEFQGRSRITWSLFLSEIDKFSKKFLVNTEEKKKVSSLRVTPGDGSPLATPLSKDLVRALHIGVLINVKFFFWINTFAVVNVATNC